MTRGVGMHTHQTELQRLEGDDGRSGGGTEVQEVARNGTLILPQSLYCPRRAQIWIASQVVPRIAIAAGNAA